MRRMVSERRLLHLSSVGFCTGSMLQFLSRLHGHLWAAPTNRNIVGLSRAMLDQSTGRMVSKRRLPSIPCWVFAQAVCFNAFSRVTHTHTRIHQAQKWKMTEEGGFALPSCQTISSLFTLL